MKYLLLLFLLISPALNGQELFDTSIHQPYISTRAMGMGNAFMAVADDGHSLFYNPAGLAKIKEKQFQFNIARMGSTLGEHSFISLIDQISEASDKPASDRTAAVTDVVKQYYGSHFTIRTTPIFTLWSKPEWAFAIIPSDLTIDAAIHRQVGPVVNVVAYHDTTLAVGHGFSLNPNFSVGTTLKVIYRGYFAQSIPAVELARNSDLVRKSDVVEGLTADIDIGLLYEKEWPSGYHVSLGSTVRNLTNFGIYKNYHIFDKQNGKASKLERVIDFGAKLKLNKFQELTPILTLDLKDFGHTNWTIVKGAHLGGEIGWDWNSNYKSSVRLGINEGYPSFGMTLKIIYLLIEYATYAQERGVTDARVENRMHLAKISLEF